MAESQKIGAAVALKALGYRVPVKSPGTTSPASIPKGPSAGKLRAGRRHRLRRRRADSVPARPPPRDPKGTSRARRSRSTVRRDRMTKKVDVKTVPDPREPERP